MVTIIDGKVVWTLESFTHEIKQAFIEELRSPNEMKEKGILYLSMH